MTNRRKHLIREIVIYALLAGVLAVGWAVSQVIDGKQIIESDDPVSLPDLHVTSTGDLTVRAPGTSIGPEARVEGRLDVGTAPPKGVIRARFTDLGKSNGFRVVEVREVWHRGSPGTYRVCVQVGSLQCSAWGSTTPAIHRVPYPPGFGRPLLVVQVKGQPTKYMEPSIWGLAHEIN